MNDQVTNNETAEILRLAKQCLELEGDFVELGCYRGDTSVLLGKLLQTPKNSSFRVSCGKPVENLCKNNNNLCKKSKNLCKSSIESVEKTCKIAQDYPQFTHKIQRVEKFPRKLWLYDSFAGLPAKTAEDQSSAGRNFQEGELFVTKREVVEKIRKHHLRNVIIKKAWFEDLTDRDLPEKVAFAFLDGDLYASIKTSLKLVAPRLVKQGIIVVHDYNNPQLPGSARAVEEFLRTYPEYSLYQKYTLAALVKN